MEPDFKLEIKFKLKFLVRDSISRFNSDFKFEVEFKSELKWIANGMQYFLNLYTK